MTRSRFSRYGFAISIALTSCASSGEIVAEFTEVESGKQADRPELVKAMKHASLVGGRLLVGKLDRLSRDLHFKPPFRRAVLTLL